MKIRQLINILFCGYRRLEIADPRTEPKPIYSPGAQGAPASNNPATARGQYVTGNGFATEKYMSD